MTELNKEINLEYIRSIFGSGDRYLKKLEKGLGVDILERNGAVKITGDEKEVEKAAGVLDSLVLLCEKGEDITEQQINYILNLSETGHEKDIVELDNDIITRTVQGKPVKPKTAGQKEYVDLIRSRMITFGIGPAGTGKTYLAMAMAVKAFKNEEVSRIILTRPAIEAGEKLGFLPGDLQQKIDPYLRPLYDALYTIMGAESYQANAEKGLIEVAPLAYMRGRTLDNAFIILDEAQNCTQAQMKMFLTRVGFGSKVVITGDLTQKDLDSKEVSGLEAAKKILRDIDEIGFAELTSVDVVRHPLVQKIVNAYEKYEARKSQPPKEGNFKKFYDNKH
ncbi:MAG: PhoH family protein [Eubacteriales bacterium]|nr:PhoH family protein [Eubacteriales bacterium]